MQTDNRRRDDRGFTLVELLIVIVILGVLATITVFAVRGITDQGEESACAAEWKNLETAQEANMAQRGEYVTEAELVANGLLRNQSSTVDITLSGGDYELAFVGTCAGAGTPTTVGGGGGTAPFVTAFNGWAAMAYGTGPTQVLLLGYGSGATASTDAFEAFVNNFEPIPGVQLLLLPDPNGDSVISASHVNALRTSGVEHVVWFDGNENVVGASGDAWFYLGLDIDFVGRVGPTPPEVGSLPQQLSNWLLPLTPTT